MAQKPSRKIRRQKLLGECAFCGQPATTKDHIPPQGMFAPGTPNLPWVPACRACNNSSSKDDEFIQRLAFVDGSENCRHAEAARSAILRNIKRPQAAGYRASLIETVRPVSVWSGPILLGETTAIEIEGERTSRAIMKIIRGLFYLTTNRRLAPGYEPAGHVLGLGPPDERYRYTEQELLKFPESSVGDRAFCWRGYVDDQDKHLSVWRMTFYGTVGYMGFTVRTGRGILLVERPPTDEPQAEDPSLAPVLLNKKLEEEFRAAYPIRKE
jgi:hypothetical protein